MSERHKIENPSQTAKWLIDLGAGLSEKDKKYYALVFCDHVLDKNNPTLTTEKVECWKETIKILENS